MTVWTPQQEAALLKVGQWYRHADKKQKQVFRLFGFAGTGKTRMAKTLDEDLTGGVAQFCAPTAKAAQVLRSKGCLNADTVHSLIYNPKEKSKQRLRDLEALVKKLEADRNRIPERKAMYDKELDRVNKQLDEERVRALRPSWAINPESPIKDCPLVILDEASMVDKNLAEDLMSYGIPILVLGDPAQLPPVAGQGYFTNHIADVMLTDVVRQAQDNPIIRAATTVRNGGSLSPGMWESPSGSLTVFPRAELTPEDVTWADQLLVGRNNTRKASNARIRQLAGHHNLVFPVAGEKLVCLKNNRELGLLNGGIYRCLKDSVDSGDMHVLLKLRPEGEETGNGMEIMAHRRIFLNEDIPYYEAKEFETFDYAGAMTVHKFQGSQADKITLFDEWFNRDSRQQWLYTGITRAAVHLRVVQFG